MFMLFSYFFMIFFSGLYMYSVIRKHLLLVLLSLEYMVLGLFFLIFLYLSYYGHMGFFLIIYLIFSVCEGVLGLSILVKMVRVNGNDYLFSSFILC